jgi:hypothetical protein
MQSLKRYLFQAWGYPKGSFGEVSFLALKKLRTRVRPVRKVNLIFSSRASRGILAASTSALQNFP